jgi:hypothetical protein
MSVKTVHTITCDSCGKTVETRVQGRRPADWHGPWRLYAPTFGEDYCGICARLLVSEAQPIGIAIPNVGDVVYVRPSYEHFEDPGGWYPIAGVHLDPSCGNVYNQIMVSFKQRPCTEYNWRSILEEQDNAPER